LEHRRDWCAGDARGCYGESLGEGPEGEEIQPHCTLHFGGHFNAKKGTFRGAVDLSAHGTVDGEPFVFNLRDRFLFDGESEHGIVTFNCHDGSGPVRVSY